MKLLSFRSNYNCRTLTPTTGAKILGHLRGHTNYYATSLPELFEALQQEPILAAPRIPAGRVFYFEKRFDSPGVDNVIFSTAKPNFSFATVESTRGEQVSFLNPSLTVLHCTGRAFCLLLTACSSRFLLRKHFLCYVRTLFGLSTVLQQIGD